MEINCLLCSFKTNNAKVMEQHLREKHPNKKFITLEEGIKRLSRKNN